MQDALSAKLFGAALPPVLPVIRVYQINECDWYAGASAAECVRVYLEFYDGEKEALDDYGEPVEVSEETMQRLTITDFDEPGQPVHTFRESLDAMIAAGVHFPCMFASTEY